VLIGLYSPAPQSGKTTVANILHSKGFERIAFADPLKAMVVQLLMSLGYREDEASRLAYIDKEMLVAPLGCTTRHLLQTLGTEWGRRLVRNDIWLKCWAASAVMQERVVADDVRFPNEAQLIQQLGGQMWKVWRPGQERDTDHVSEGGLDTWKFDRLIVNDGNLDQLSRDVNAAISL